MSGLMLSKKLLTLASSLLIFQPGVGGAAEPLPNLLLLSDGTTVSGLSSGAFMAVQLQTAFSASIHGAGVVAGGPFDCAGASVYAAVYGCLVPPFYMLWFGREADVNLTLATMEALDSQIDASSGLRDDRIYLFHGTADDTVRRKSMDVPEDVYLELGVDAEQIRYVKTVDAGHAFLTEEGEVSCATTAPDYLNDCDIDQAGEILTRVYGALSQPVDQQSGNLKSFDQSVYADAAKGMDELGFIYIPSACASGDTCRLHIALHGCQQGRERIGDEYARTTGYNNWAEANNIVVLYPQALTITPPFWDPFGGNPKGCWDWWGYSGADYLSRSAPQLAAIARMAAALGAPLTDD